MWLRRHLGNVRGPRGGRRQENRAMRLQPVIVPYRYDEREVGLGRGPGALLAGGLIDRLAGRPHDALPSIESLLTDEARTDGPVAANIGALGARTAEIVATARRAGDAILILAGDDTAAVGVVAGLQRAEGAGTPIGVVWFDAHGDFNTPETSFSGILAGMPVAILAGLAGPIWRAAAGLVVPVPTDRIVLAGVRDLDDKEATLLRSTDVKVVSTAELRDGSLLKAALDRLVAACSLLYVHVDLDLLDPRLVPSASTPADGGLEIDEAAGAIGAVLASGKVAALGIAGLNPGAGSRGERSVKSALSLIERTVQTWERVPGTAAG
jgi:arginase